ncbi:unnamed protein product [Acanthoscelides obtectus]|uniref:Uncharacterized protein n=1 Tax=Acanthoscelides obtectus TaxID=200917 RepID=A0A9P0NY43_ACAOB|nr:unnamed protein product [Acanthoscelides obtectus]CAK1625263.1 hypothetical protein AOBTE_LOCUS3067 [Acanthoscelides obtectus]
MVENIAANRHRLTTLSVVWFGIFLRTGQWEISTYRSSTAKTFQLIG